MPNGTLGKAFAGVGLACFLVPGFAAAECVCTCLQKRPIAICNPPAMVEPICQQLCTDKVEQSLNGAGAGGGLSSNALSASPSPAAGPANAAALRALLGR